MKPKIAAIYNTFDGLELLPTSIESIKNGVDLFIIVDQDISNFGEPRDEPFPFLSVPAVIARYTPDKFGGGYNETKKRNLGIEVARQNGCTHFILMDCDEMYQSFEYAKDEYLASGRDGSVAKIITYFKKPTLRLKQPDNYWVPFIHRLHPSTRTGDKDYPFYVDPTRRINVQNNDVFLITDPMHHFSWVRKDINKKVRNSTAQKNIAKSQLVNDYFNPATKSGSYIQDYHQHLIEVEDHFNLLPIFA